MSFLTETSELEAILKEDIRNANKRLQAFAAATYSAPRIFGTADCGWSNFYRKYPRRADLCHLIAPYVATQYKRIRGVGEVGWLSADDNPSGDAFGEPTPAWALGPKTAVEHEKEQRGSLQAGQGWRRNHHIVPQRD